MRSPELFDGFCHLKQRSNKTTKRRFLGSVQKHGMVNSETKSEYGIGFVRGFGGCHEYDM